MLGLIGADTVVFDSVNAPLLTPDIDRDHAAEKTGKALDRIKSLNDKKSYDPLALDEFICLIAEWIIT